MLAHAAAADCLLWRLRPVVDASCRFLPIEVTIKHYLVAAANLDKKPFLAVCGVN